MSTTPLTPGDHTHAATQPRDHHGRFGTVERAEADAVDLGLASSKTPNPLEVRQTVEGNSAADPALVVEQMQARAEADVARLREEYRAVDRFTFRTARRRLRTDVGQELLRAQVQLAAANHYGQRVAAAGVGDRRLLPRHAEEIREVQNLRSKAILAARLDYPPYEIPVGAIQPGDSVNLPLEDGTWRKARVVSHPIFSANDGDLSVAFLARDESGNIVMSRDYGPHESTTLHTPMYQP